MGKAWATSETTTVTFTETTHSSNRNQTITIPNLQSVENVRIIQPSNASISYSVNGENVTITVGGGSYTRSNTSSNTATGKRGPQQSTSFPSTISYNSGGYSGTLSKSGSYYQDGTTLDSKPATGKQGPQQSTTFPSSISYNSGGYSGTLSKSGGYYQDGSTQQSKYATAYHDFYSYEYHQHNGSSWYFVRSDQQRTHGGTYPYSDADGYSGDIPASGASYTYDPIAHYDYPPMSEYPPHTDFLRYKEIRRAEYAGTVYKTIPLYSQNYSGTVYKSVPLYSQNYSGTVSRTDYYWQYIVEVEYVDNFVPIVEISSPSSNQPFTQIG